jgi:hypothetical protein
MNGTIQLEELINTEEAKQKAKDAKQKAKDAKQQPAKDANPQPAKEENPLPAKEENLLPAKEESYDTLIDPKKSKDEKVKIIFFSKGNYSPFKKLYVYEYANNSRYIDSLKLKNVKDMNYIYNPKIYSLKLSDDRNYTYIRGSYFYISNEIKNGYLHLFIDKNFIGYININEIEKIGYSNYYDEKEKKWKRVEFTPPPETTEKNELQLYRTNKKSENFII